MSTPKENITPLKFPQPFINKVWHVKYELVFRHFCSIALSIGYKPTTRGFCEFLQISAGKREKWSKGQWPSAEDLEKLHDRLGFSYRWLITGEGDPFEEGGTLPEADIAKKAEEARIRGMEQRIRELEKELQESKAELAEADRLNRRLTTRMLIDGAGDKDAQTSTGKASGGQG